MDCLQVCEVLSAAHDREPVDATLLSEAKTHAGTCAECRRFAMLLERLDSAASPQASGELLSRLEARTAPIAADLRSPSLEEPAEEPAVPHLRPRRSWVPRFTALATAAAVVMLALTAGTVAFIRGGAQEAAETASIEELRSVEAPQSDQQYDTGAADAVGSLAAEAAPAPAYVTFGDEVWVLAGAAAPAPSTLATAGTVTSSLDDGASGVRTVYFAGTDDTLLYARTADGGYLAFEPVIRTRGRSEYVLVSGTPITDFGVWPTLPERFEQPTDADGSPTFRYFGSDDAHLQIYVPPGGRIEDGFAIAPGTTPDDPAAGNPNWTWWQRYE